MGNLRVKLDTIKTSRLVGHCSNRRRLVRGNYAKIWRQRVHFVTVAHPYVEQAMTRVVNPILNLIEKTRMQTSTKLCIAKLTRYAILNRTAKLGSHCLHAVANSH